MTEKYKEIRNRYEYLHWDLEYWDSYIYQYENNQIEVSEAQKFKDLEECSTKRNKTLQQIDNLKKAYPEYLI